jgi:hypothetical protein
MVAWIDAMHDDPRQAACSFFQSVHELLMDNRAIPIFIVDAANRCYAAVLGGDADAIRLAVGDAVAVIMEKFNLVRDRSPE